MPRYLFRNVFLDVTLRKAIRNEIEGRHTHLGVQQAMLLAVKEEKRSVMISYEILSPFPVKDMH